MSNQRNFENIISNLRVGKQAFFLEKSGARQSIFIQDKLFTSCLYGGSSLNLGTIDYPTFVHFLSEFKRDLLRQLKNKEHLFYTKKKFSENCSGKNTKEWKKIKENGCFLYVDINSAYWQSAFNLGYISEKLFYKYKNDEDFKHAKRYCFSFLARQKSRDYFYNGKHTHTIDCNNDFLNNVYENVRNNLYGMVRDLKNEVNKEVISWTIDSISTDIKHDKAVRDFFKEKNIEVKTIFCKKVSENVYLQNGKERKI